jgi:uncharacterized RDD family membrane protein YckC
MNWFYVQNGAQAGPVDDSQLDDLLRAGTVTSDSLVWREGMATWEPYRVARATPAFGAAPPAFPTLADTGIHPPATGIPAGGKACAQCGLVFPDTEVVQLAGANVCANCKPIALQRMREGTWIAGARRYGGFWIRVAAMIIDSLIVGVAFYAVFIPLGLVFGFANFDTDSPNFAAIGIALGLIILVGALVSFGYQIFFLTKYGATPGKLLLGLKVIRSDGGPITAGRAVGRMFAHALSHMILYIGYIVAAFDKEKRALHDHVCDTRVIYKS